MEKKITCAYLAVFLLGIVVTVFFMPSLEANIYNRMDIWEAELWNSKMNKIENDGVYIYKTFLPKDSVDGRVIVYDSVHMQVEVTIGAKTVYSMTAKDGPFTKTTGCYWNFIFLTEEDAGKEIVFYVTPCYADSKPQGKFYYGAQSAVERMIINARLPRFMIATIILTIGLVLLIYVLFIVRKAKEGEEMFHFAIFAIMLGIWYICETQILELITRQHISIIFVDHLMLMLMALPFLLFLRQMYHSKNHPMWKIMLCLNGFIVMLRILMQIVGLFDLRETLWMTHIAIGLSILVVIGMSVYEITAYKMTKQVKLNLLCVGVIMLSILLELAEYRIFNKSTPIASLGFLFYIVVMGVVTIRDFRNIMTQMRESRLYRKLAFTDELTGVYNRAAFNRDLDSRKIADEEKDVYKILPTVIYMFDLNDLKKCNDNYGHECGDIYIKTASQAIIQVYGDSGKCYRIGGDEFCAISDDVSQEDIENKRKIFAEEITNRNVPPFVVPISVAMGYAVYDPEVDMSLEDTMKRADAMMYKNKQAMKNKKHY